MTAYALAHGREWIALPATNGGRRRQALAAVAERPELVDDGEFLWIPGLRLMRKPGDAIWLAPSLEIAEERRQLLAVLNGIHTRVVRKVG